MGAWSWDSWNACRARWCARAIAPSRRWHATTPGSNGTRAARCAQGLDVSAAPLIRHLGLVPYEPTWRAMQRFTDERDAVDPGRDLAARASARLHAGAQCEPRARARARRDSGGARSIAAARSPITVRASWWSIRSSICGASGLGVRQLVVALENAVIAYAAELGVDARAASREAPGVYVDGRQARERRSAHPPRRELSRLALNVSRGSRAIPAHQRLRLSRPRA